MGDPPRQERRMNTPAIEVSALSKTYPGGVEAVKAIDFEVAPGEVFGLLGPNGAGKSTTIGMLTTTVRPTSGSARLAGFDVVTEPLPARAVSSVVFQDSIGDRSLSGRRNLEIHARLWRVEPEEAKARIAELAAALGVDELLDRAVSTNSAASSSSCGSTARARRLSTRSAPTESPGTTPSRSAPPSPCRCTTTPLPRPAP